MSENKFGDYDDLIILPFKNQEYYDEVKEWCTDMCESNFLCQKTMYEATISVFFADKNDAALFKLSWMDEDGK